MDAASSHAPKTPETFVLQDAAGEGKVRFTGVHLAFSSTGESKIPPRERWLTLNLYRKTDGTYILHRIGYSIVYHDAVNGCNGGEKVTLGELLEATSEGSPCPKCNPRTFDSIQAAVREDPNTPELVSLERVYYKVLELKDVPTLVAGLKFVPRASRTGIPIISRPGQELLLRAAEYDEKIAMTLDTVKDI